MRNAHQCPKCGSTRITGGSELQSFGNVAVQKYKKPKWYQFSGNVYSEIEVYVCNECGYLEQYAMNPEKFSGL